MIKIFHNFLRRIQTPSPAPRGIPCALVGLGGYAEKILIPTLLKTKKYNLVGVCSKDKKRITTIQRMFRIPDGHTSLQEYLNKDNIELVFITQKDSLHANTIEQVAEAKKHIFVEKPLVLTPEECTRVKNAVKKNKVHLTVGLNRRFSVFGSFIKEKLQTRTAPVTILYKFNQERKVTKQKEWVLTESNYVHHTFGHFIDFTSWILDAVPVSVYAESLPSLILDRFVPHDVIATVTFSDGSLLNIVFTLSDHHQLGRETIEIYDSGNVMILKEFRELRFYGYPCRDVILRHADKGQYSQLHAFAKFLRGDKQSPFVTIQDGINTTLFSHAVLESISKGCPIHLIWKKK